MVVVIVEVVVVGVVVVGMIHPDDVFLVFAVKK